MVTTMTRIMFIILLLCTPITPALAGETVDAEVLGILNHQLDALKNNNHEKFIAKGNKAFKEFTSPFDFESLYLNTKNELNKEYALKYLGSIQRIGMIEYLWPFKNNDNKNEHLVRMSLTKDKVYIVGFTFD